MTRNSAQKAASIVRDAGGRVVGRTRLQKVAYFLEVAGLGQGFSFEYRYYGPYSEDLAVAARDADLLGLLMEKEQPASWGGSYSTYTTTATGDEGELPAGLQLASEAAQADAVELELAATAVFLAKEGHADPWAETARRKPEKAEKGRLDRAKALYRQLVDIETPTRLPVLP